jgi:uncharacterized membrane protein
MPSTTPATRLLFADWLRAWALLVMIETHVFNAFLAPQFRELAWFGNLNFLNGMVAPSFLFVSGFVFLIASQKRLDQLRELGKPLWQQVRKVGMVWLIGYALHLPTYWIPSLITSTTPEHWSRFYRVDVLHCIAFTWLLLLATVVAIRGDRLRSAVWLGAAAAFSWLAPFMYSVDFPAHLPEPLAGYLNDKTQSLFPIFPWSGFMLAGAACASWFLAARSRGKEKRFMTGLAATGLAMVALGYTLPPLGFLPKAESASWQADPRTFLLRLGIVLLLLGVCWVYGLFRAPAKSVLLDVSHESLFVYVVHLLVIYGPVWQGSSLAWYLGGKRHGPLWCLAGSVMLAAAMMAGARGWSAWKKRRRPRPATG